MNNNPQSIQQHSRELELPVTSVPSNGLHRPWGNFFFDSWQLRNASPAFAQAVGFL